MTSHDLRGSRLLTMAALLGLLAASLLGGPGCSKKGGGRAKAEKVDCNELCDKTFGTCVAEVLLTSGKMDNKKLALLKRLGLLKKIQKDGHDQCLKACRAEKGQFHDSKAVNACLKIADCKKFAPCVTKYIK